MALLVIGATGALGRDVVAESLEASHPTVALVRDPERAELPREVELRKGDVVQPETLVASLNEVDTVICTFGTPNFRRPSAVLREGTVNLVNAMRQEGVRRLVCVTLLGTGASRTNTSLLYRAVILRALAPMVPDKEAQEQVVRTSGLDWTLVRPPRFRGSSPRGSLRVIRNNGDGRVGQVVRRDLARFLFRCAISEEYIGEAVVVGS
ncbi:MAG: NAD(P)H-binding protein [Acidimicrobiales bacterium]